MRLLPLFISLFLAVSLKAQSPSFRQVKGADGLNDGTIEAIGQDAQGYIWIGTASGLNRYDGYGVRQYLHRPADTTSIYAHQALSIGLGPDEQLYIGFDEGLVRYNATTDRFSRLQAGRPFSVGTIQSTGKDQMALATSIGLVLYQPSTGRFRFFRDEAMDSLSQRLARLGLGDLAVLPDGRMLGTSFSGLLLIDLRRKQVQCIRVPQLSSQHMKQLELGPDGTVWINYWRQPKLVKTDLRFQQFEVFDYLFPNRNVVQNALSSLLIDRQGELWITTVPDGLCRYNKEKNAFQRILNQPFQPSSLSANHLTAIFQDRQGLLWLGTGGYGVNYFNPERQLFHTVLPRAGELTAGGWMWGRAAAEDEQGHLWLATLNGVVRYDTKGGEAKRFWNAENKKPELYSNSVRGIWCTGDTVWILTGEGVNRYHQGSGRMEFLDEKDSLPKGFYFTVLEDRRGRLWIGGRDGEGLYFREKGRPFCSIASHPLLHAFRRFGVRALFEDRKGRLWFGLNGGGLGLYDEAKGLVKHWTHREGDSTSLAGNLVTGIGEDRSGAIWVSTTSGVSALNEASGRFRTYSRENGLPSVRTSCIRVDGKNRVWVGSTQGLLLLEADRQTWRLFDRNDGLPDAEFADMPSAVLRDGRFVFPTLGGFVLFDPLSVQSAPQQLPFFLSGLQVLSGESGAAKPVLDTAAINLKHDQNFFSIELTALYYENPRAVWYAYQLEGFDRGWVITRNRMVNYTNVPGGRYRFRYRASLDPHVWTGPEKTLSIRIATVYYRSVWFWLLIALISLLSVFRIYRFRMQKQQQILRLESRAKELEKEKTIVQYESLKQQLNPHFLFNSLTSLRSLIKSDTKTATNFLDGLSKVYRYVLKSREQELTTLRDELGFVETFIALQQTRFGEGLRVVIQVDEAAMNRLLVPVTLQNLVENALKHNTADVESPLRIRIWIEDECVVVSNNLQRYRLVETSNRLGLIQLRNLYAFYTSRPVTISEENGAFTVKIPLL
jgi:ligand-binding sensor domain-containing protein